MDDTDKTWHENDLPKNFDAITYLTLAAVAIAIFIFGLLLTDVLFAGLAALIVVALMGAAYTSSLRRPASMTFEGGGLRYKDRRDREGYLSWDSVLEIRQASQRPDSHFLCIYRDDRIRRSLPLGPEMGRRILRKLGKIDS